MEYTAIILAAGIGQRMGYRKNKVLLSINDIPIIVYTLKVFEQDRWCKSIILVIHKENENEMNRLISRYQLTKVLTIVEGGQKRQDSVYAGLQTIHEDGIVLVHDGARPFVKMKHIHILVEQAVQNNAAILAVPVKDTTKIVDGQIVKETLDRSKLWSIQTPQAFRVSLLKQAHEVARINKFVGNDEATLVEQIGKKVYIVEGEYDNIKITTPEDLILAKAIVDYRRENFFNSSL